MKTGRASLLLCLLWSPAAKADAKAAAPAPQVTVPTAIPSDGVLPVFGGCYDGDACAVLRTVTVTDAATGAAVAGHVEIVVATSFDGWGYFVPDEPFRSGSSLLVKSSFNYPTQTAAVRVTETGTLDMSALSVDVALSKERKVLASQCCPDPSFTMKPRCIDVSVLNGAVMAATLSPAQPVATQYEFELRLYAGGDVMGGTVFDFAPLRSDGRLPLPRESFDGTADKYCYAVRAKPVVGGEPVPLMEACVENTLTDVGRQDRTSEEVEQWLATCQVRPPVNDGGTPSKDDDGPIGDDDPLPKVDDEPFVSKDQSGCQLASSGAPQLASAFWPLALALLSRSRRRQRT
jgi:hypothetical protein